MVFGCEACLRAPAEAAWRAVRSFALVATLVEESHVSVRIRACPACGQHVLTVFTERIDWSGGDDPQDWSTLPITAEESASLRRDAADLDAGRLGALGAERACLRAFHPSGGDMRIFWSVGPIGVPPHD
jgi:hypothetical protein